VAAGLNIIDAEWEASSSLGAIPQFNKQNVIATQTATTVSVSGDLTNANIASTGSVIVDVIFFGPDGSPIGASQTEIDGVTLGQTVPFSVLYPQTGSINPPVNEVLVYGEK
jgi:hypothetical protein